VTKTQSPGGLWRTINPPLTKPTLYHYTDQAGLLGILQSKAAWATHIQYMNDAQEFDHMLSLVRRWMYGQSGDLALHDPELHAMTVALTEAAVVDAYVFSLSEKENQLSQWRGYGGSGGGFAIGFRAEPLFHRMKQIAGVEVGKCVYDESMQRQLVDDLLTYCAAEIREWRRQSGGTRTLPPYVSEALRTMYTSTIASAAPYLKSPDFYEENEWRVVARTRHPATGKPIGSFELGVRVGATMLRPYVSIALTEDPKKWGNEIAEIWVGPTAHQKLAFAAVRYAIERYELADCDVKESRTPLRA
jgi:hypothetical protein